MSEAGAKTQADACPDGPVLEAMGLSRSFGPIEVLSDISVDVLRLEEGIPVRRDYILEASLITKDNAKDFYFKNSPF